MAELDARIVEKIKRTAAPAEGLRRGLETLIGLAKLDQAEAARFWERYAAIVADWRGRGA